jgi:hypothetical protein
MSAFLEHFEELPSGGGLTSAASFKRKCREDETTALRTLIELGFSQLKNCSIIAVLLENVKFGNCGQEMPSLHRFRKKRLRARLIPIFDWDGAYR